MKYILYFLFLCFAFFSCAPRNIKIPVDQIFTAKKIYTFSSEVDSVQSAEAMVVKNGIVIFIGSSAEAFKTYEGKITPLEGEAVFPGFIDAHGHIHGLGDFLAQADLTQCTSMEEVIETLRIFRSNNPTHAWILGRGWDQNKMGLTALPDFLDLNKTFPDIPVWLGRVDGHAALVNSKAFEIAGISNARTIEGGWMGTFKNGAPNGILVDLAMELVRKSIPSIDEKEQLRRLLLAQNQLFKYGIVSVHDAGCSLDDLDRYERYDSLQVHIYAMMNPDYSTRSTIFKRGKVHTDKLDVSSFKIYSDGALGSRGACLLDPYSDDPHHYGVMLIGKDSLHSYLKEMHASGFQVNTHAIGDSANRVVLNAYANVLNIGNDARWRIEHAQMIDSMDVRIFGDFAVLPSIQPVHAVSDGPWVKNRLGDRVKSAYIYKSLLAQNGWMPLGTDFPVEHVDPIETFCAAVYRCSTKDFGSSSFQEEQAISREEALKGMTLWAARAAFNEYSRGRLNEGFWADFVCLSKDIMRCNPEELKECEVLRTFIKGKCVYSQTK